MMIRVAIAGIAGRMGQALIEALSGRAELKLVAAFERPQGPALGEDAGLVAGSRNRLGIPVTVVSQAALRECDVLIDFTRPEATVAHARACAGAGCRLVAGTTGLDAGQQRLLRDLAAEVAIVHAPNMSPGVNLCFYLVEIAARALGPEADIEVIEAHHRHKKDAPSGTALQFGAVAAAARGLRLEDHALYGRHGTDAVRRAGEIGFSAIRGGDIVGDHTVLFALAGERVEITHRASTRDNFARGALLAAGWIMERERGLYDMQDVLGLRG